VLELAETCARQPWPGTGPAARPLESLNVDHGRALERFLADVERRAFRIARMATGNDDDALDLVQDAMLRLARHYGSRPQDEWKPLFHRILTNGIRDFSRRRRVRQRVFAWWPARAERDDEPPEPEAVDPAAGPGEALEGAEAMEALERALAALPDRQREAFVLRTLEGLDVAATAVAMGCSEGSVKTHYFRAVHALRERLGEWRQ
jgi:RNA polymerase sigma-70 factor (ECF subfamily)